MSDVTKQALAQALKELMTEHSFDKITVTSLTQYLGINRQTFYYHFKDIYELLTWLYVTDAEKIIGQNRTYTSWQEGFLDILYYVKDNEDFVKNTYHSLNRAFLEDFLYQQTYELLKPVVWENKRHQYLGTTSKDFMTNFLKFGFVGIVLDWIGKGMRSQPEELVQQTSDLIAYFES